MGNQELNMEKILEATNDYFKGNKDANLTDLQMNLLRNIAEYDDATNNLIKWLNDAIENDEERTMENYIAEATNAYEDQLSINESKEFVKQLKKLNPDVDVKLSDNYNSIDISKPITELNIPKDFYLDENNFLTNKENTALSVFVSLKVNEIKENNKDAKEEKEMNEDKDIEEVMDGEFLEESPKVKKEGNKSNFSIINSIKKGFNFIKNKFKKTSEFVEEEIDLDSDSDTEELEIDLKKDDSETKKTESNDMSVNKEENNKNNNAIDTLGSMKEKYQMLGYEVELKKNKAITYYKEHEEEIKKGSKKQLEKYASKLSKIKELETEYSILGNKIEARRKFEAKKMDQLFNDKYEKRDNVMSNHLTNANDLEQELKYREMKAATYFNEHEEEIRKGSKKHLEKYASKLSKVKEMQNEYEIANTKYNSLRKEKEDSYNMLFR